MTDGRKRTSGLEAADVGLWLRPKNIGARIKRVEDPRLLTGQGAFTADRLVPGALHVAFRRSDHAHALISGISTSAGRRDAGRLRHLHRARTGRFGRARARFGPLVHAARAGDDTQGAGVLCISDV